MGAICMISSVVTVRTRDLIASHAATYQVPSLERGRASSVTGDDAASAGTGSATADESRFLVLPLSFGPERQDLTEAATALCRSTSQLLFDRPENADAGLDLVDVALSHVKAEAPQVRVSRSGLGRQKVKALALPRREGGRIDRGGRAQARLPCREKPTSFVYQVLQLLEISHVPSHKTKSPGSRPAEWCK